MTTSILHLSKISIDANGTCTIETFVDEKSYGQFYTPAIEQPATKFHLERNDKRFMKELAFDTFEEAKKESNRMFANKAWQVGIRIKTHKGTSFFWPSDSFLEQQAAKEVLLHDSMSQMQEMVDDRTARDSVYDGIGSDWN